MIHQVTKSQSMFITSRVGDVSGTQRNTCLYWFTLSPSLDFTIKDLPSVLILITADKLCKWFAVLLFLHARMYMYNTLLRTDPLTIVYDDPGRWFLWNMIEVSYLYIQRGHYFISTLRLRSKDEYVRVQF